MTAAWLVVAASALGVLPVRPGMSIEQAFQALGSEATFVPSCGTWEPRPGIQAQMRDFTLMAVLENARVIQVHAIQETTQDTVDACSVAAKPFLRQADLTDVTWTSSWDGPAKVDEAHASGHIRARIEFHGARRLCRTTVIVPK
jgi:hypothetical protein